MIFQSLFIENWNQFDRVDIKLHPRLTVITGANGAGKSTILRIFSRLTGWSYTELASPSKTKTANGSNYILSRRKKTDINVPAQTNIGNIRLANGSYITINAPNISEYVSYDINLSPMNLVKGFYVPSHRTPYSYKKISSIPVKAHTKSEAFYGFNASIMTRITGDYSEPPIQQMKSALISLAIYGGGNDHVQPDSEALDLFLGFISILKKLLPPTLGFDKLRIQSGEVIIETASGDFLLDAVSGGIGSIIDLAWQIYMFDTTKEEAYFVLIDEAENHLHASMQRQLLPNLLNSFPNAQFIVSTHSPLMVNSVKDSSVYALKYNEENAVISEPLDFENKAANASRILREVLGVPVTMPVWVEDSLNEIISKYRMVELTPESYTNLKFDLSELGLADHLPQALGMLQGDD